MTRKETEEHMGNENLSLILDTDVSSKEDRLLHEPLFKDEEMRVFIGPNADYYLAQFKRLNQAGTKKSWNWAAFFGQGPWLIYRKILLYAWKKIPIQIIFRETMATPVYGNWVYKEWPDPILWSTSIVSSNHIQPLLSFHIPLARSRLPS